MLCPECGMQLLDEESICPSCGKPVVPESEMWVEFRGARPEERDTADSPDRGAEGDAEFNSTQMIGSEDPTLVRPPAGDAPAEGTEVLVFGGEYIFDDPDETGRLGSNDPTAVKGAAPAEPAAVPPSEQGIVDMSPEEIIPAASVQHAAELPAEALGEVAVEPSVEVEGATELLGSDFPTNAKPAHDAGPGADLDKNLRRDIDPLASSGALDALGALYDTGGMQFPVEGMEDSRNRSKGKELVATDGEKPSFGRRHRKGIIALVTVIVLAVAAAVAYGLIVVWPTHAVSDDEVRQTLVQDDAFMQGRASDMFVAAEPYEIESLTVDDRTADESGLKIAATVQLKNTFFSETSNVSIVYPDTSDSSRYDLDVVSHKIVALRGISQDAEYGVYDASPTFDQATQECSLEQKRAEASGNRWWFTESGEIKLAYKFTGDSWTRTLADTSNLTSSFQHIVGTYGAEDTRFTSFAIRSVDNDTGAFSGTFSWEKDGAGWFGSSEVDGRFTGTVHRDGTVEAVFDNEPGTLAFTGSFGDGETLTISGAVYLDSALSTLGFTDAPSVEFSNVTLVKGDEMVPSESDNTDEPSEEPAEQAQDSADSATSEDASGYLEDSDDQLGSDVGGTQDDEAGSTSPDAADGYAPIEPEAGFDSAPSFDNAPWSPFSGHRRIFNWGGSGF